MPAHGYTVFETPIGACGLAWSPGGVAGVQLPGLTAAHTQSELARRFPEFELAMPCGAIARARDAMIALLAGRQRDLSAIALDMRAVTPFRQQVYTAARDIPRGMTMSYGELAAALGKPKSARAVGQALGANPFPIVVPCHRVLAARGAAGGFSAVGGVTTKARMLAIEGAATSGLHGFEYEPDVAADYLRAADKRLARIIDAVGPPRIELTHTSSIFVALARAIVYQQLSGKAAATIFGRVSDLFPARSGLTPAALSNASVADLRGAGLSNNKVLALKDLALRTQAGEIPGMAKLRRMSDDDIVETLTRVRGIGRWTVEMMLMFRLGRADVMAVDDLGLRQGHARIMRRDGETDRKTLAAYAERWRPYRSVASWYLWRAVELERGQ